MKKYPDLEEVGLNAEHRGTRCASSPSQFVPGRTLSREVHHVVGKDSITTSFDQSRSSRADLDLQLVSPSQLLLTVKRPTSILATA